MKYTLKKLLSLPSPLGTFRNLQRLHCGTNLIQAVPAVHKMFLKVSPWICLHHKSEWPKIGTKMD